MLIYYKYTGVSLRNKMFFIFQGFIVFKYLIYYVGIIIIIKLEIQLF